MSAQPVAEVFHFYKGAEHVVDGISALSGYVPKPGDKLYAAPPDNAYVLCANDLVQEVFLGSEAGAKARLEVLARAHYDRNPWSWDDDAKRYPGVYRDGYHAMRSTILWAARLTRVST